MNIRTAKVLEMDDDIHVARNAARGIMAVAGNLRARGTTDFVARTAKVAAVAAEHAGSVDGDFEISRGGHRRRACRAAVWHRGAARIWRRGRRHRRSDRRLLYARPRLCIDRDDLRDAPGGARLHRTPRPLEFLAPAFAAPGLQRTDAAGVLHHGRAGRRRSPQQHSRDRATKARASRSTGKRPSSPTATPPTPSSRPRAALPKPRVPTRCSSHSSSKTTRWSL